MTEMNVTESSEKKSLNFIEQIVEMVIMKILMAMNYLEYLI